MSDRPPRPTLRRTQEQFGRRAGLYAESALHRGSQSLETVLRLAAAGGEDVALDVGTGAGFTALALAQRAKRVLAVDPTAEMLAEARRLAAEKGLEHRVAWALAVAEGMPFADDAFDIVTCRFACHHFHDLPLAMRELARVVKPGGRLVVCEVVAPESVRMEQLMNDLERRRDPTHVWDYRLSRWLAEIIPAAGLRVAGVVRGKNQQHFHDWVRRAGTPSPAVRQLREMLAGAAEDATQAFEIRAAGREIFFSWDNAVILAERAD